MYALVEAEHGDVRDGREAHAVLEDVRELDGAVEVNRAREGDAELLDDHADERHHGDAAVLDLDVTEAVEVGLITVGDEAEGIVEAERGLGSELCCGAGGRQIRWIWDW